jgi:hypothetical protein
LDCPCPFKGMRPQSVPEINPERIFCSAWSRLDSTKLEWGQKSRDQQLDPFFERTGADNRRWRKVGRLGLPRLVLYSKSRKRHLDRVIDCFKPSRSAGLIICAHDALARGPSVVPLELCQTLDAVPWSPSASSRSWHPSETGSLQDVFILNPEMHMLAGHLGFDGRIEQTTSMDSA